MTFFLVESLLAYFFCYKLEVGFSGLWYGWIIGSVIHIVFSWLMLVRIQKQKNQSVKDKKQPLLQQTRQYDEGSG